MEDATSPPQTPRSAKQAKLAWHAGGAVARGAVGNMEDTPRVRFIDMLLKGVGYIHARRSRDQSMQEGYITQAIIREILSSEKLLVMFPFPLLIEACLLFSS